MLSGQGKIDGIQNNNAVACVTDEIVTDFVAKFTC